MKQKYFLVMFFASIGGILLFDDFFIKELYYLSDPNFSTDHFVGNFLRNFAQPFMFVALPFLMAFFMGWKKGFIIAVLTSAITLTVVWFTIGERDFWFKIYGMFFASFSVVYLVVSSIMSALYSMHAKKV